MGGTVSTSKNQMYMYQGDKKITLSPHAWTGHEMENITWGPQKYTDDDGTATQINAKIHEHRAFRDMNDWMTECNRLHAPVMLHDDARLDCVIAYHATKAFTGALTNQDFDIVGVWYKTLSTIDRAHWVHHSLRNTPLP